MFNKMIKKAIGNLGGGLFRGKKKAATDPATAGPPVAMDPTAMPSEVPLVTQPTDSPFAAVATAAAAKMPAKKTMATPAAAPGKKRFGQMFRRKGY